MEFIKKSYVKNSEDTWRICISEPFDNCDKIYPTQQVKIQTILNHLESDDNVLRVIIFGSSVTPACHIDSDVDIYVELKKDENPVKKAFPFAFDLWTNFTVDERLTIEISKKGVVVFERRNVA